MIDIIFYRSIKDAYVYHKHIDIGDWVYLFLHVDDTLIASNNENEVNRLQSRLKAGFEIK